MILNEQLLAILALLTIILTIIILSKEMKK